MGVGLICSSLSLSLNHEHFPHRKAEIYDIKRLSRAYMRPVGIDFVMRILAEKVDSEWCVWPVEWFLALFLLLDVDHTIERFIIM